MSNSRPQIFASKQRAVVIAAAGCGKTELIARAVASQTEGRQLILTHTHAGVKSLRDRLSRLRVPSGLYRVDTIAGFALSYALSFPKHSGLSEFKPVASDWADVYEPATKVCSTSAGKTVLRSSYLGFYVDEYQDCTLLQHKLVMAIAEALPCRIVGDPLQGIFDFEESPLVNWSKDIFPCFERLPDLEKPWRWENANKGLGAWLIAVRSQIMSGERINLQKAPPGITWMLVNPLNQRSACFRTLRSKEDSVVAIHKWDKGAHSVARNLRGAFTSMEEVESRDLLKWSDRLERDTGTRRGTTLIDFASKCMTKVSTEMASIRQMLESGKLPISPRVRKHVEVAPALDRVCGSDDFQPVLDALCLIEQVKGAVVYRRELLYDMKRAIREYSLGKYPSLQEAAWSVRDKGRILGRRVEHRTVSRTLLIKGLGFDHAIVLNADDLNAKELYVAMTRGSKSLTVLSSEPILTKEPPKL
jgi:hypothetical protein